VTVWTPAAGLGVVFVVYLLRRIILKGKRISEKEDHARLVHLLEDINFKGACLSKGFLVLIVLYLKTSTTILQMFQCRDFEELLTPEGVAKYGTATVGEIDEAVGGDVDEMAKYVLQDRRLNVDYKADCNSDTYFYYKGLAWIMVMVYPLGVPVTFLTLLLRNRATIHDSINMQKYGFIFKDYGTIFFIWEIWDLFRKLMMSGLLILFEKGSADQISVAILFSIIALTLHARAFPYSDPAANWIQLGVLMGLQLTLFGSLVLKMSTGEGGLSQMSVDIYLTSTNIMIPCCLVSVVAWETQRAFTSKARMKLSLAKKRKRQQQLLEESGGIDMRQVHDIMMEEDRVKAENKANSGPGMMGKLGSAALKGTGAGALSMGAMAVAKHAASKAKMLAKNAISAKDLFPTLADERRAVKRLQFDQEKTLEASVMADREAKDLGEWIDFAQDNNASENELMSFVRAFGEELLADINVHDVDDIDLEIGGTDKRGNKSSAVQLAEHYPFIKSAAMALKRHHM